MLLKWKYFYFHSSCMLFLISPLDYCFWKLFPTKMRGKKTATRKWTSLSPSIIRVLSLLPSSSLKTIKKPEVNKKLSMQDTYVEQRLCIFLVQMLRTVSISFINSKLVRMLYLEGLLSNVVKTVMHHYYCVPVKSFILINMRLTSPYVQE